MSSSACARTQNSPHLTTSPKRTRKGSMSLWRGISSNILYPTRHVRGFSRFRLFLQPAHPAVARGRPRLRLPSLHPIATWQPSTPPSKISSPLTRPRARPPTCDAPLRRTSPSSPSSPCLRRIRHRPPPPPAPLCEPSPSMRASLTDLSATPRASVCRLRSSSAAPLSLLLLTTSTHAPASAPHDVRQQRY